MKQCFKTTQIFACVFLCRQITIGYSSISCGIGTNFVPLYKHVKLRDLIESFWR